ncbi:hypothetical protein BH20ACT1_BH20ACT1_14520 [soil metagenome]
MADPVRPWRRPPPPPPDPSILPPDLVDRAKGLRLQLGDNMGGGSEYRRRTRNAYDEALVEVADLLELPGAPDPDLVIGRRVLTTLERSLLEKAVMARGIDLGIAERSMLRVLGPGPQQVACDAYAGDPTVSWDVPWRDPPSPIRHDPPTPPEPPLGRRERLLAEARMMRRRLDLYEGDDRLWPTKVQEWCEDLDAYDGLLIDLAVAMGIPAAALPEGDRRRLLSEERTSIESGLAQAGHELSGTDPR